VSKETLGYPTRTEAVIALAAQGLDNRAIGARIGISPSTVAALAASAARAKGRTGPRDGSARTMPQRGKYGMPTAQLETMVMDLYEEGLNRDQIAQQLSIRRETADKVIGYMQIGRSDHANGEKAVAHASAMLLAAIRRHHPERCGA
jgi:DNA-binding NarL/FixJ family response regulator